MSRLAPLHRALEATGALGLWRQLRPGHLILCYHNVIAQGARPQGDASLHLPLEQFEAQLDWVSRHYRVVPLLNLAIASTSGDGGSPPMAAITFDDAYTGVVRHALPALRARGLTSTIFVTTEASEHPRAFWWDTVAQLRPEIDRVALRDAHAGSGQAILFATGLTDANPDLPAEYLPAGFDELRGALDRSVRIGAHTRSHPMLAHQPDARLRTELEGVLPELIARIGNADPMLAYPYGNFDARVAGMARSVGYRAAVTTEPSLVRSANAMLLPRLNVPAGMSYAAFRSEASGVRLRRRSR